MYIIKGSPTPLIKAREHHKRRSWDEQLRLRAISCVTLEDQHGDNDPYTGALHLDIIFFFMVPQSQATTGRPHISQPSVSDLVQFIEWVGKGIIFSQDCIIASIAAKKFYDAQPRTEFSITRLE